MNLEDAFMQLFERKGRIGDQIRQQVRFHTETLSVNFVAAGGGDPSEFCWKNGAGAASDFSFPAGFTYQFGVSKEDTNIGRESEDAYKDIEDVSNKLSHVFAKSLIEGSNKTIVQTEGNGLEHATVSISPSVNIPEKITAVDTENNNILEVSNRKRNSTPVKYPESKKHFFRNPTVLSTIPLSEYLEIIPSEKDNVPLDADELKTSNDPKEVCTIALERQYFSKSSTCNNRKVFSESNRTSKSSKAVSYACNPNNTRFGRNKSEVKDSTASLSEYLEIIPSVKDSMFLDAYEPETSRGSKYEVVDGFVEKITMHDDLCNPSRQALNSASSLICNVNSTSHIFSKRQDAMVINRSRAVPLKHNLFLQTTTKTDDNYDITEDHMIASECLYFDRKVMSAEPNRTFKPSDDVPFACNYDMKCSEMSKREVRESLSIYGTSQRPRLNSFLDSNQCKLKISSVDTPEPIKGFYNSMLQNVSNDENMEFHNSTMLNTSLIKHSGDIQQMKLQVSRVCYFLLCIYVGNESECWTHCLILFRIFTLPFL
ncbi:hypothetical protein ZOSMA_111G00020 [Zostera marina]|uniref:Uncharacterized protein n=1 Tax=Zostera marina TaxID=29655 RepID=A0A0K9Q2W4_ZOSMR|nr:hypothetical protein ZOSMA_111G00020 [Zostera marina]